VYYNWNYLAKIDKGFRNILHKKEKKEMNDQLMNCQLFYKKNKKKKRDTRDNPLV
jgi:hypothetical protein